MWTHLITGICMHASSLLKPFAASPFAQATFPLSPKAKTCLFKWEHDSPSWWVHFTQASLSRIHGSLSHVHVFLFSSLYFAFFSLVSLHMCVRIFLSVRPALYKAIVLSCLHQLIIYIRIQEIQFNFEVFFQSVWENLVLYLECWRTQVVFQFPKLL